MTRIFLTVCCVLLACALPARHIPNPFDRVSESPYAQFKKELAWDLKGFIYAAPTASVTYLAQFGKKENHVYSTSAFRLHANGYSGFPFREVTDIDATPLNTAAHYFASGPVAQRYKSCNVFVGIEKQHFIRRLAFYHGMEIGGGYSRFTSKYFDANNPVAEEANEQQISETKILLSCFAGLKFFVVPQVSLSVECNAFGGIGFQHQKVDYYEYDPSGGNAVHETAASDARDFFLKSNSVRTVNIAFHF